MTGRDPRGKGSRKGRAKHPRIVLGDNIQGITKLTIRRLARRGGVDRLSGLNYEEIHVVMKVILNSITHDIITFIEHAKKDTVNVKEVCCGLNRYGSTFYGSGR